MEHPLLAYDVNFCHGNLPLDGYGDFHIEEMHTLMFSEGGGIELLPTVDTGIVSVTFHAFWLHEYVRLIVEADIPEDPMEWVQQSDYEPPTVKYAFKYSEAYYSWDEDALAWVVQTDPNLYWGNETFLHHFPEGPWDQQDAVTIYLKINRGSEDNESPVLRRLGLLYRVAIGSWGAYISSKLVDVLRGMRFIGRLQADATTRGTDPYYLDLVDPLAIGSEYADAWVTSVIRLSDHKDLFVAATSSAVTVSEALVGEEVEILFEYAPDVIVNQGLDLIQIEKFPALVVSDLVIDRPNSGAQKLAYKDTLAKDAYLIPWPSYMTWTFVLHVLTTLYWDSTSLSDQLVGGSSNPFVDKQAIALGEVGLTAFLEPVGNVEEDALTNSSSGNKTFSVRMKLLAPSPIPQVETNKLVYTGLVLDTGLSGAS